MIIPDGFRGAAFGTSAEGDLRHSSSDRARVSRDLGIPPDWAFVTQVHGRTVLEATRPGDLGEADAVVARTPGVPAAVASADCVPVILEGERAVAVVHAGWRGAAAGVLDAALASLDAVGSPAERAAIGPAIGPCCYEVGPEVAERFPGHTGETTWGTTSVDLPGYLAGALGDLPVWSSGECTYTSPELYSYRKTATTDRQVAVGWLPAA